MDSVEKLVPVLGRILLALVFVLAGYAKIWTTDATAAYMASHGIPLPNLLVYGVVALELGGGLLLMFGLFTRWIALVFAIYLLTLALTFHDYWAMPIARCARAAHRVPRTSGDDRRHALRLRLRRRCLQPRRIVRLGAAAARARLSPRLPKEIDRTAARSHVPTWSGCRSGRPKRGKSTRDADLHLRSRATGAL